VANETNVSLLRAELGAGEAEAIIQAQEKDAAYFIGDEKRARENASNMGRKVVGTVRVLARLNLEGKAPDVYGLIRKLRRDLQFRASDYIVEQAIAKADEPI
jgi:predicted nucleic acid-binding protein